MSMLISSYAHQLKIADISTTRNVTIVQLTGSDPNFPQVFPYSLAYEKGFVRITEKVESGTVPEILAENFSDELVLIIEGEVLIGAKQNRTVNTTMLLAPKSKTIIPVSCVEQGRWSYRGRHFTPSSTFTPPDIRSKKVASMHENIRRSGLFQSNQGQVWHEVSSRLAFARVASHSSDFSDYAHSQEKTMEDFTSAFKKHQDTIGIVGFINGNAIGCDVIPKPDVFGYFFDRLIRSYALDAVYMSKVYAPQVDYRQKTEELFTFLDEAKEEQFPSPGLGSSIRISGEKLTGSALVYNVALIHLAMFAFNKQDVKPDMI